MTEPLKDTALQKTLSDVVADLADLFQKEVRLARTEISEKVSLKLHAGIWLSIAGAMGFVAVLFGLQTIVLAIASLGVAMHWAALMVAAGCAVIACAAFFKGKADAAAETVPTRTIRNVKRDIATAKEQLS